MESISHAHCNVCNWVFSLTNEGLVVMPLPFAVKLELVLSICLVEGR